MTSSQRSDPGPAAGAPTFAVVGAGIAGITCARQLAAAGSRVRVFERAAVPGGRLAAHHSDGGDFDIGAQYLTVQNEAFADEVRRWVGADLLRSWDANLADLNKGHGVLLPSTVTRFVGVPRMDSIAKGTTNKAQ